MAENTRKTLGEQATLDALVSHTLTELYEDGITALRAYALYHNTGLETLTLPNIENIGAYALSGCTALTALVLPKESVCELAASNALENTPIASGSGYIYVPDALVNTYKGTTNWSVYAGAFKALSEYE